MASFFSNLFGGGAQAEAADRNRALYGQYSRDANRYLDTGLDRSVGAVTDANNRAGNYWANNYDLYSNLGKTGTGILDNGLGMSLDALGRARGDYDQLAALGTKYGGASSLLLDSLGVNGAGGNGRATAAFQTGPGYNFTRDSGLDAINRRRAAAGMLASGNADADAIRFGTGLADQTYGDWQTRLGAFTPLELQATSGAATGRAGVDRDIAGLYTGDANARLGLAGAVAQGQAGSNAQRAANDISLGNALSGLYTGDANNRVNVAGSVTSGNTAANNQQAQAETQGARNLFNTGMQVASLAAGGLGGGMGGSFGSMFGGGGSLFGNGTGYGTNPWSNNGIFAAGPPGGNWAYSRAS